VPFDDEFRDGARRAWAAVSSLDIVARFRRPSARVGFYLYPPTVGLFDPTKARWIIFLYSPGKVAVR
jgi:hypothetical protein